MWSDRGALKKCLQRPSPHRTTRKEERRNTERGKQVLRDTSHAHTLELHQVTHSVGGNSTVHVLQSPGQRDDLLQQAGRGVAAVNRVVQLAEPVAQKAQDLSRYRTHFRILSGKS